MYKLSNKRIILLSIFLIFFISLTTSYYGSTDITDYAGVAKFFAGEYSAKLRTSHTLTYGLINSPLVYFFKSFWIMKLVSVILLSLIILSVYYITGKSRKALLLIVASPIIWYMGPWINPIQLSSLLFLWGYFYILKYKSNKSLKALFYSGLLFGLSYIFWNTVIFILIFLIVCFFYDEYLLNTAIFALFVLIGILPLLILDYFLYNFAFYTTIKFIFGILATVFYGGIYDSVQSSRSLIEIISFLIIFPFFAYTLLFNKSAKRDRREIIFLSLSFIFLLTNPQVRYLIFLLPIMIIYLNKYLTESQFKLQLLIFFVISLIVITPYLIQINYYTNSSEFTSLLSNFPNWEINKTNVDNLINSDINQIGAEYPLNTFLVIPGPDDYSRLAMIYWGDDVKEFVSIQDYNLWLKNETIIFNKKLEFYPKIADRRSIWIGGGISKNIIDSTNYNSIKYAISLDEKTISGFHKIKKYNVLTLLEKDHL